MKEAAGEANMTVITIVLIAIVLAVGTIIVTSMLRRTGQSSQNNQNPPVYNQANCTANGGTWRNNTCTF